MYAFRAAHAARDSKSDARQRDEGAERPREMRSRQVQRAAITELTLRREVARDLESLMNCVAMESTVDLAPFPAVRKSILNYGFPDIAHRTIDELEAEDIFRDIEDVLRRYEPREIRGLFPLYLRLGREEAAKTAKRILWSRCSGFSRVFVLSSDFFFLFLAINDWVIN